MHTDDARCLRAVRSRDARFDGVFVTAVRTTGIYCRPSCPARTPHEENVSFHPSAAAAQAAGYRACKRCRPDAAPGSPDWNVRSDAVARAMRLIADGVVDRDGVPALAAALGYSVRQLERLLAAELGAGPLALAQAQRAQVARTLLESTGMPVADVAFAAGFASVRAFNDVMAATYAVAPRQLRAAAQGTGGTGGTADAAGTGAGPAGPAGGLLALRLPFREPLEVSNLLGHLVATAVPGVEEYRGGAFRSTLRLPRGSGVVAVHPPVGGAFPVTLRLDDVRDLPAAVARCRRLLDADADPVAVDEALATDPHLRPLVTAVPGRRVPHTLDPEAMALRAVLGQQVSTAAARTHAGRLVAALGQRVADPDGGLTHTFPRAADVVAATEELPEVLRMPATRRATLLGLAQALADGDVVLDAGADWRGARAALAELPGIGPWTIETIAMRALGDPDAFLAGDLGVVKAARSLGLPVGPAALGRASGRWAPWRAYAVQHLWATSPHAVNSLPSATPPTRPLPSATPPTAPAHPLPRRDPRMSWTTTDSPVGELTLVADSATGALTGVYMPGHRPAPDPARFGEHVDPPEASTLFGAVVEQLAEYFAGRRHTFDLPTAASGTAFQQAVWAQLTLIEYGTTATYGQLAARLGNPGAMRAVGLANGRNPLSIVVPCHRVVGADGSLTGFAGGPARKQFLLDLEAGQHSLLAAHP